MNPQFNWKSDQIDPLFAPQQYAQKYQLTPLEPEKKTEKQGRRVLSNTKRAAQNRSAQKAFRQRKEKYIKDLEATAAQVADLHKTIEELRQENLQLRDYTLALQSRLIELSPNVGVLAVPHDFNKI